MHPMHFSPAYRIETERLILRCWQPQDAPLMQAAVRANVEHLRSWLPWVQTEPGSIEEKIARLRKFRAQFDLDDNYTYAIFNLDETRVLGGTGLDPRIGAGGLEIGYWIDRDFTHQGLASEAAAALTRVAFEHHKVRRVEIHCDPHNTYSAAIPHRLGYTHEATLRERVPLSDEDWRDDMVWSLLAGQYPASPSAHAQLRAFDAAGRQVL